MVQNNLFFAITFYSLYQIFSKSGIYCYGQNKPELTKFFALFFHTAVSISLCALSQLIKILNTLLFIIPMRLIESYLLFQETRVNICFTKSITFQYNNNYKICYLYYMPCGQVCGINGVSQRLYSKIFSWLLV